MGSWGQLTALFVQHIKIIEKKLLHPESKSAIHLVCREERSLQGGLYVSVKMPGGAQAYNSILILPTPGGIDFPVDIVMRIRPVNQTLWRMSGKSRNVARFVHLLFSTVKVVTPLTIATGR